MKTIATLIAVTLTLTAALSASAKERPADSDVGSCYSAQPICIGSSPVCVCNYAMQCYWACR